MHFRLYSASAGTSHAPGAIWKARKKKQTVCADRRRNEGLLEKWHRWLASNGVAVLTQLPDLTFSLFRIGGR